MWTLFFIECFIVLNSITSIIYLGSDLVFYYCEYCPTLESC
uniref:Uncharacterized protein n=1 Tax=Arundo donax TaxID=35708 RepID=A0A0A9FZX3_ARUDO